MRSNHFDNTIFGITITGQGISNVVEGTHGVVLRHLLSLVRRLSSSLASWRAFKSMPAARWRPQWRCVHVIRTVASSVSPSSRRAAQSASADRRDRLGDQLFQQMIPDAG